MKKKLSQDLMNLNFIMVKKDNLDYTENSPDESENPFLLPLSGSNPDRVIKDCSE
jgi:hypothetical protein